MLKEKAFREFCIKRNLDEKTIRAHIEVAKKFEASLRKKGKSGNPRKATADDLQSFLSNLMKKSENTMDNFLGLLRYSRFVGNRAVEVRLLELLDGSEVLEKISEIVRVTAGENKQKGVFRGIELPPLGTSSKDKPEITRKVMERLESELGEPTCREALLSGPHAEAKEYFLQERKDFLASKNIDDFLEKRHKEYVAELEKHMKEKTLYFTQEIDKNVLEYVRRTPTCQNGVRKGDVIYVTKIPYMAQKYLHETDPKMKRYYYCHCPWVRESMISGVEISPNFCYCSAGFEKRPWDVIFDQPVKADVVQSVLRGDLVCEFAIHVPQKFLESQTN
jgi:hypothetical protein